jgi:hypothetical protein
MARWSNRSSDHQIGRDSAGREPVPLVNPFLATAPALPEGEPPAFPPRRFRLDGPKPEEILAAIQDAKIQSLLSLASEQLSASPHTVPTREARRAGERSGEFDVERIAAIDLGKVGVGAIDFAPVLLSASATRAIVERKIEAMQRSLFGVEAGHAAFAGRVSDVQLASYRKYLEGRARGELVRSEELIEYHRLVERSPEELVAALDPRSGRIVLAERIEPPELPITTKAGASDGIEIAGLTSAQQSYLRSALDAIVPAEMLSILSRSGTKLSFVERLGDVSPTASARFGEGCAIADLACPELGRYWAFLDEALIPLAPETTLSTDALLSVVVHELAHALDWALGAPGEKWSDSAEWKALFAATEVFPTERSAQNPAELFAECAAIYLLGRHVETQPLSDAITTRTEVLRTNGAIYRRIEQLFTTEVAARDREGCRIPEETKRSEIERALARARAEELERPSFASSFHVAAWSHILSVVTGSLDAKAAARSALAIAEERERASGGDGSYAAALQREVDAR